MVKNVLQKPGRTAEIGAKIGSAFASRSAKGALASLPEIIGFYIEGKKL